MGEFICHLHGLNDFPRIHGFKKNFSALFSRRGFTVRTVAGILDHMECGLGKLTADTLEVSGFSTGIARAMDDNDGHLKLSQATFVQIMATIAGSGSGSNLAFLKLSLRFPKRIRVLRLLLVYGTKNCCVNYYDQYSKSVVLKRHLYRWELNPGSSHV